MKSRLLSLAALLMAGAASGAMAQGQPTIENGGPMYNAGQAAKARQGQNQPAQQQAPEHGPHRPPQAPAPPQAGQPPAPPPADRHGPPSSWNRPDNGRPPGGEGDRQTWNGRGGPGEPGPDHRDRDRWQGDHRERSDGDRHRWDGDRREGDHRDWNRPGDGRGPDRGADWDRYDRGPPPNAPRWAQRRYPPVYSSPSRYHGPYWRPPEGYYVRTWRYGEVLPRGWYGPDYRLFDWWSFGLPEPPPGYDWVRVGRDALLVDYTGRIYQVVRFVFW